MDIDLTTAVAARDARGLTQHILDAEEDYLGCCFCFRDPALQREALGALRPEDLPGGGGPVLAAAQAVHRRGEEVWQFTVDAELTARGDLERIGGKARLVDYANRSQEVAPSQLKYFVAVLKEAREARELQELPEQIGGWLADTDLDLGEVRNRIVRAAAAPLDFDQPELQLAAAGEEELRRVEREEETPSLKIGLPALDYLSGGLEAGEVGLICGLPGSGKTVLGEMQAFYAAEHWGPGAFVSLEMHARRLMLRAWAGKTGLTFHELRANRYRDGTPFGPAEWDRINTANLELYAAANAIYVLHDCYQLDELLRRLRRLAERQAIRWVVIDYGGLLSADVRRNGTRAEEESVIARALKNEVAVPLNLPVWCLVQPNKEHARRGEGSLLKVSDIIGASEWRAVANQIWLLNRDPAFPRPEPGETETDIPTLLEVAKSRDGGQGIVPLMLRGARFQFVERDVRHGEPPTRGRLLDGAWEEEE